MALSFPAAFSRASLQVFARQQQGLATCEPREALLTHPQNLIFGLKFLVAFTASSYKNTYHILNQSALAEIEVWLFANIPKKSFQPTASR
jgi:hypothetical protein